MMLLLLAFLCLNFGDRDIVTFMFGCVCNFMLNWMGRGETIGFLDEQAFLMDFGI